jgi:hypothetical protein
MPCPSATRLMMRSKLSSCETCRGSQPFWRSQARRRVPVCEPSWMSSHSCSRSHSRQRAGCREGRGVGGVRPGGRIKVKAASKRCVTRKEGGNQWPPKNVRSQRRHSRTAQPRQLETTGTRKPPSTAKGRWQNSRIGLSSRSSLHRGGWSPVAGAFKPWIRYALGTVAERRLPRGYGASFEGKRRSAVLVTRR